MRIQRSSSAHIAMAPESATALGGLAYTIAAIRRQPYTIGVRDPNPYQGGEL